METDLEGQEFEEGLLPGFSVIMSKMSAHVTSEIFMAWMEDHFLPRTPSGNFLSFLMDIHRMSVTLRLWVLEMKTT